MPKPSGTVNPSRLNWRDPSTWHLRTRLVLVAMALLVAICGAIGIVSYASMDFFLTRQLDNQLVQAAARARDFGRLGGRADPLEARIGTLNARIDDDSVRSAGFLAEDGTGWHRHDCEFQIVVMLKGWARFMYEDKSTLVQAGDVVHQRPGIVHYLYDYSPDMEYMEIVSPADFKTVDMPPATDKVPPVTPWK